VNRDHLAVGVNEEKMGHQVHLVIRVILVTKVYQDRQGVMASRDHLEIRVSKDHLETQDLRDHLVVIPGPPLVLLDLKVSREIRVFLVRMVFLVLKGFLDHPVYLVQMVSLA
jgi:hypothetical protein